jgi:hypothetical protein
MKKMKPKLSHAQKGVSSAQNGISSSHSGISSWLGRETLFFDLALKADYFFNYQKMKL